MMDEMWFDGKKWQHRMDRLTFAQRAGYRHVTEPLDLKILKVVRKESSTQTAVCTTEVLKWVKDGDAEWVYRVK